LIGERELLKVPWTVWFGQELIGDATPKIWFSCHAADSNRKESQWRLYAQAVYAFALTGTLLEWREFTSNEWCPEGRPRFFNSLLQK
jgi:hypothetical protein